MKFTEYIRISDFCKGHDLEESFLHELHEVELIRIVEVEHEPAIHQEELDRLERLVRLHRDFEIGPHGLLAVDRLLDRLEQLQEEIWALRRRLGRWE